MSKRYHQTYFVPLNPFKTPYTNRYSRRFIEFWNVHCTLKSCWKYFDLASSFLATMLCTSSLKLGSHTFKANQIKSYRDLVHFNPLEITPVGLFFQHIFEFGIWIGFSDNGGGNCFDLWRKSFLSFPAHHADRLWLREKCAGCNGIIGNSAGIAGFSPLKCFWKTKIANLAFTNILLLRMTHIFSYSSWFSVFPVHRFYKR